MVARAYTKDIIESLQKRGEIFEILDSFKTKDTSKSEEELKAAEKEYGGKPEKKHQKGNADPDSTKHNPKSLFHQDDEDYVPPVKDEEEAKPEIKTDDSGAISKAPLKDDKKHDKKDN